MQFHSGKKRSHNIHSVNKKMKQWHFRGHYKIRFSTHHTAILFMSLPRRENICLGLGTFINKSTGNDDQHLEACVFWLFVYLVR